MNRSTNKRNATYPNYTKAPSKKQMGFVSSILFALFIAIMVRSLLFEPFSIPSGSMKPNFFVGDYLFVTKCYGVSKHSFPFSPNIFSGRKFALQDPVRGDVVVFRGPKDPSIYYIKRLIGLPGDKVQVIDGLLHVNGAALKIKADGLFEDTDHKKIQSLTETNLNGISYKILNETPYGSFDNTEIFEVPVGNYFMMGDNRDGSIDSRMLDGPIGFVPEENIIGKAYFILFSNKEPFWLLWNWLFSFDLNRFFIKINP